jgi:biopolymer transport protein ExbD
MNFRPKRSEDVEVNLTSLIDVIFLLLLFFMLSTTFEHKSEMKITLPEASEEVKEPRLDAIRVAIDRHGNIFINDDPLPDARLVYVREALERVMTGLEKPQVIISADAQATHQAVVRVMDAARQVGLVNITFATRLIEEQE